MSLVPGIPSLPKSQPQTHVFIIGIGHYPCLRGGETPVTQHKFDDIGLGQLSSPSISASHVYNTVMDLHKKNNWLKPLGSVELLISSNKNEFPEFEVEVASLDNIRKRYFEWKERCDGSKDNVALFYFCGHGLEKHSQYLLTQDFGKDGNNPWIGAFDFDTTRRAFHECKAETQIFFIDACRQATISMITHDLAIAALDHPSMLSPGCKHELTTKATAANSAAYAPPDQSSFFAQAVVKGLSGHAATSKDDIWKVSTDNLGTTITEIVHTIQPLEDINQRCLSVIGPANEIIQLLRPPRVDLEISCNPDEALTHAALFYEHADDNTKKDSRSPDSLPWLVQVEAGIYRLGANFVQAPYRNTPKHVSVNPPFTKQKLKCYEQ